MRALAIRTTVAFAPTAPTAVAAVAAIIAVFACGCGGKTESAPVVAVPPTEEIAPAPDKNASIATDPVAVHRESANGISGVLPEGFPRDVPLPGGTSLVDFGGSGGAVWITLDGAAPLPAIEVSYRAQLGKAGFREESPGEFRRGARRVILRFEDRKPGSRIRVEVHP